MKQYPIVAVNPNNLKVDRDVNFRDDYDLPSMMDQILTAGRVTDPVFVQKEDNLVLKGNRRVAGSQELLKRTDLDPAIRANLENLDVIYIEGLSERERVEFMLDHGANKPLSRAEVVKAVWRLKDMMWASADIMNHLYQLLARFTGNLKKAHEAMAQAPGAGRTKFLTKWLNGTVNNYLIGAYSLGEYVRGQVLLTELSKERELTDAEKATFSIPMNRERIMALGAAKKVDEQTDAGWNPETGGVEFNKLLDKYRDEESGTPDASEKTPVTKAIAKEQASSRHSDLARLVYTNCSVGLNAADTLKLVELDAEYDRIAKTFKLIRSSLDRINKAAKFSGGEVHEVLRLIVDGTPPLFDAYVKRFTEPEVKTEPVKTEPEVKPTAGKPGKPGKPGNGSK